MRLASAAPDLHERAWDPARGSWFRGSLRSHLNRRWGLAGLDTLASLADSNRASAASRRLSRAALAPVPKPGPHGARIAVAGGRAFTFRYAETVELLRAAGAEVVDLDPLTDTRLPEGTTGLYLGGGFPEMHAAELGANEQLRRDIRTAIARGLPTVAECAGLLYLCESVRGPDGPAVPMVGAIDAVAEMAPRLTLSYRTATAPTDNLLARAAERSPGTSSTAPTCRGPRPAPRPGTSPTTKASRRRACTRPTSTPTGPATRSSPRRFVEAAAAPPGPRPPPPRRQGGHEGSRRPRRQRLRRPAPDLARPRTDPGGHRRRRLPRRHRGRARGGDEARRDAQDVLATAGAAEAFTLIARLRDWRHPVVVHPQFTEPEVALRTAGHTPGQVVLTHEDGFRLRSTTSPTTPTSWSSATPPIRPAYATRPRPSGASRGRAGWSSSTRPSSTTTSRPWPTKGTPGLVVLRSLTKIWSIPGIRAGYLLAEPQIVEELRHHQTPWSVSAPAIAALIATSTEQATDEARRRAEELADRREHLQRGLDVLGIETVPSTAPYVLARTGSGSRFRDRSSGRCGGGTWRR